MIMVEIFVGGSAGFIIFMLATHPGSKVNKRLPDTKFKNLQVFPRLSLSARNRVFHVHHWMFLTPILILIQNLSQSNILHGFVIGGIVQGLLYKDRFNFVFRHDEYHLRIKNSSLHFPFVRRIKNRIIR